MKLSLTSSVSFPAGHQTEFGLCAKGKHGHSWVISATCTAAPGAIPSDELNRLGAEFAYRDFNDMARGVDPTPQGLAAYFLERLRMPLPEILAVEVSFEGQTGRAER